ncbi:MAG: hypothetical protein JRG73_16460 [Deltaproteobacteria bacterium]|nr:hypothetical protein [Deltaproteobacteria bacterium]
MTLATVVESTDYVGLLTHTCTVQHKTAVGTDRGGLPIYDYITDTEPGVPCRPDPIKSTDVVAVAGEIVSADFRLFLLKTQSISKDDRITDIKNSAGESIAVSQDRTDTDVEAVFSVIGRPDDAGAQEHHMEVLIKGVL